MITFDNNIFHLSAGGVSYLIGIQNGIPLHLYWGDELSGANVQGLIQPQTVIWGVSEETAGFELPVCGQGDYRSPAVEVVFSDGSRVVNFAYQSHQIFHGKPALQGLPATYCERDEEAQTLELNLRDALTGLEATLLYTLFENGVIARSMRLDNHGASPVKVSRALSASVDFCDDGFETITLQGAWARETHVERSPLFHGIKTVDSKRGHSSHTKNPFMALVKPSVTEQQGEVYAVNLIYSGNFAANAEVCAYDCTRLQIGVNPFDFEWILAPGSSFQTPEAVLVYSGSGLNGMSHRFHDLYRSRLCRGKYRDQVRPLLINNWEATYFSFKEEDLLRIATIGRDMGLELFVLDDGWFGKRDNDDCSLGDWFVNQTKLPNGLSHLAAKINEMGLRFGLWLEPEMVSPDSDLYRSHPDWCIHTAGRERTQIRNQLTLDLSKQEVCDYVIAAVSGVLESAPIDYVKWDMNRPMLETPSQATAHAYMLGLYSVLETITSRFPNVLFEGCSGGGGRFDGGMLSYMPQIWVSDDTDAYERMYIQYGTSLVYPPCCMDNNVSAVPNHQTGRSSSFETRGDVALCGNFGYQMDLALLNEEERTMMRQQVALYKQMRQLIHDGDFTRLQSPYEGNECAWQIASKDKSDVLFCAFTKMVVPNHRRKRIRLAGLLKTAVYRSTDGSILATGDALMQIGIPFCQAHHDFESAVVHLRQVLEKDEQ